MEKAFWHNLPNILLAILWKNSDYLHDATFLWALKTAVKEFARHLWKS